MMRRRSRTAPASALALLVAASALLVAGCGGGAGGAGAPERAQLDVPGAPTVVDGAVNALDPSVAIDDSGRIHLAWTAHAVAPGESSEHDHASHGGGIGGQHVFTASSTDGGRSWSNPVRVTRAADANAFANAHVKVLALGGDRLLLTYPRYAPAGGFYSVRRATSADSGRTWSAPMTMREGAGYGAGESYQSAAGAGDEVWASMLVTPADSQDPVTETSLAVVSSLDGGTYWEPGRLVDPRTCECCDTAIAVDSADRVFVAYRDQRILDERDPARDVSVVRSFDKGATWSDPVAVLDRPWRSAQCPEAGPELAIDSRDRLHVVQWTGREGAQGVVYASSEDHGERFESLPIVEEEFFPSATVDLAIDGEDHAWTTWDDHREDAPRIWLARIDGDRELAVTDAPIGDGEHPAVAARDDLVVVAWSTREGELLVRSFDPADLR
jgi:hypothetical protein